MYRQSPVKLPDIKNIIVSNVNVFNVLDRKCIKSSGKSQFSLSFLFHTVNDVRKKPLTVEKRAKRMPDTTVETTPQLCNTSTTDYIFPTLFTKQLNLILT